MGFPFFHPTFITSFPNYSNKYVYFFLNDKWLTGLNGHLSIIAHAQTCRGVSNMRYIKFHSGEEKLQNIVMMTPSYLKSFNKDYDISSFSEKLLNYNKLHDLI